MRKRIALCIALVLLTGLTTAVAQEATEFADLRAYAPEGTFLEPGAEPMYDENSYRSEHIAITITRQRVENADVTIADIYVSSMKYLRRAFSGGAWKKPADRVSSIALSNNAILAMSGDYASLLDAGLVAANGEVFRKSNNKARDNCLILKDGTMVTYPRRTKTVDEMITDNLWHSFLFGPRLLDDNGQPFPKFDSKIGVANPRSVIGYYGPGHFCFVLVDGRSAQSKGLALIPLSRFMSELGCKAAYNLDGGQSAMMYFRGQIITEPYNGGRKISDIVYIGLQ
ncbi:MAG: phosphodiester glycosidase family protein [Christensenellales bacterium]|jgi:exopolysaccharide biosynthesis protein